MPAAVESVDESDEEQAEQIEIDGYDVGSFDATPDYKLADFSTEPSDKIKGDSAAKAVFRKALPNSGVS